jgi:hypothetical protein
LANSLSRSTPYLEPHSTSIKGEDYIQGGDDRFYNNIFVKTNKKLIYSKETKSGYGTEVYDKLSGIAPIIATNNLFLNGARPSTSIQGETVNENFDP